MKTITVPSDKERLYQVQEFVEECLSGCNIANYAYHPHGSGDVDISCDVVGDRMKVVITFTDEGPEFDPLEREDPDTTLGADERPIGGLGIYLVKNTVDGISYRRENGRNILTVEKELS